MPYKPIDSSLSRFWFTCLSCNRGSGAVSRNLKSASVQFVFLAVRTGEMSYPALYISGLKSKGQELIFLLCTCQSLSCIQLFATPWHWIACIFSNCDFFLHTCPGVRLLDRVVALYLVYTWPPYCSPWWLYQFTFLPTVYEGSLFSTPSSAFTVCRFLNDSHLTSVRSYLILALTCVFLVIGDAEHLLMCLLAICMPSLEKCLFRPYVNFLIGLFVCLFVCF